MIEQLAPGVPALRLRSPYDVARHTTDESTAVLVSSGLFLRTRARPGTIVARFQPDTPPVEPDNTRPLAWVVRVDVEVHSGHVTFGYSVDEGRTIRGEQTIDSTAYDVDLLLDASVRDAQIVLRAEADRVPAELIVRGFDCYCVVDDDAQTLDLPAGAALRLMPRWARFFAHPSAHLASRVRHLRFSRLTEPRPMRWLHDLEIELSPGEQISRAVYVSGVYEPCSTSVLQALLGAGQTCIDVGANIGLISLLASRWVGPTGRVISFEPSGREFARLRRHIERNRLENVTAERSALGDRTGTATLHVAQHDRAGHNTLEERFVSAHVTEAYAETVPLVTLDDYVAANQVTKVDVIKIDVEGGEPHVIEGAQDTITRDRPALLIEVGEAAAAPDHQGRLAIESMLRRLGYAFVAIDGKAASLASVVDLTAPAENFLAALPDTIDALHRQIPVAGWRRKAAGVIASPIAPAGESPYLSIVLTGRNDESTGERNARLFRTLEFNHAQLEARGVPHEFVFVEWRPVSGAPWLAEILADRYGALGPRTLRCLVVDAAYHDALTLNPRLQVQEFLARNVGIRRSRGTFVLTTTPDVVLSRGVLEAIEQRTLRPRVLYRAARVDLRRDLDSQRMEWSLLEDERNHVQTNRIEPPLYSNTAGDFLVLDRESFVELRGFNEIYRVANSHIARNFCLKALSSGVTLTPLDAPVYHLGHGAADDDEAADTRWRGTVLYDNDQGWGLSRAPVRLVRDGLERLEFAWAAVAPAVALRRVVLPVARTT